MVKTSAHVALALLVLGSVFYATSRLSHSTGTRRQPLSGRGPEVAVVMFVSPSCAACNNPALPGAWKEIRDGVSRMTPDSVSVRLVGVSVGSDPEQGWDFLSRFGDFDEIATGGGVMGQAGLRYLVDEFRGPGAVPQVLILDRRFEEQREGGFVLESEAVRTRIWGLNSILMLAARFSEESSRIDP